MVDRGFLALAALIPTGALVVLCGVVRLALEPRERGHGHADGTAGGTEIVRHLIC